MTRRKVITRRDTVTAQGQDLVAVLDPECLHLHTPSIIQSIFPVQVSDQLLDR